MSGTPDDARLLALGAAMSDGAPIDWDDAERSAGDPDKQRVIREMRRLAAVVAAHRLGPLDESDVADAAEDVAPARHWCHIVLFESIGTGAFGTVYRGWDPTLDREVAVKLVSKSTLQGGSPLEEARHLARVRHANVVVVYGADRDGDEAGIWMEYIEGQTLAQMVRDAGPMSAREVTGIGLDLCRALAALHGVGLLHRDLKPQNVMREVGGRIVLMDFSGAQVFGPGQAAEVTSGTPSFMAPELFASQAAGPASEVYSLGVLLFFLLSGRLPVEARTIEDLKRAHEAGQCTRLSDVRPDVPTSLAQVIGRAIAPDAAVRYQTAGEFEHALATASGSHAVLVETAAGAGSGVTWRPSGSSWLWLAGGVVLAAAIALMVALGTPRNSPAAVLTRFTIGPPFTSGSWPRVSPNGQYVVFGAIVEGRDRFWVRALDDINGRPLMKTIATESPFWSPDSTMLCFFADGKLKRIPIAAGDAEPEVLADAPLARGGDWSGSSILFGRVEGIHRLAVAENAALSKLTSVDQSLGDYQHGWPEFLPDGRRFLFVIRSSQPERAGVYVASIDGDAPRRLMPAFSRVSYADGHLLFVRQGMLMAQRFDAATATLSGQPVQLADRVKFHGGSDSAFDVSTTGVLVFGRTSADPVTRLMLFDGRGREVKALTPTGYYRHPRFSADGRRVVAEKIGDDRNIDLWLFDIDRGGVTRLTRDPGPDIRPAWSPDGQRIAFSSKRGAVYDVYLKSVDTTGTDVAFVTHEGDKLVEHWSADGRFLSGTVLRSGLWVFPLAPGAKPWKVRADGERAWAWQSEFSPDGNWLAYTSRESGNLEVYVEPVPATGARFQVSTHGGAEPHWRRGGRELLYLTADGTLMMTTLSGSAWHASSPMPLFRLSIPNLDDSGNYAVSSDGERLVVNTFISDPIVPPIDVVVNWTALLPR